MFNAKNTPWLKAAKRTWNDKIYRRCMAIYNLEGQAAAANYLQQFTTAPIDGATVAPPKPLEPRI